MREVSTFNAVEFSKTGAAWGQTTKSLRLAPEAFGTVIQRSYPLARRRSSRRVTGFLPSPLLDGLGIVADR
jgi:hypothetical protein